MWYRCTFFLVLGWQGVACSAHTAQHLPVSTPEKTVTALTSHTLTRSYSAPRLTTESFRAASQQPMDIVIFMDDSPFLQERLPALLSSWHKAFALPEEKSWDFELTVFAKAGETLSRVVSALPPSARIKVIPYDVDHLPLAELIPLYATGHHPDAQPRRQASREWLLISDRDFAFNESWGQTASWHLLAGQAPGHDDEYDRCFVRERATQLMALQEQSGGMFFDLCSAERADWAQEFVHFLQARQGSYQLKHQPDMTQIVEVQVDGTKVDPSFWHLEAKERRLSFHPGFGLPSYARVSVRYGYTDAATMAADAGATLKKH